MCHSHRVRINQGPTLTPMLRCVWHIAPSTSRMFLTSELQNHKEPLFTLIFSPGIISPHMLHCPFLATVYSFLGAVFHIPPGAAVANLLCLEPACPQQCWEQKLHSCAAFAIKVTCEELRAEQPSQALQQGLQIIYGRRFREPRVPFPEHFSVWARSWFYGKHSTAGVEG